MFASIQDPRNSGNTRHHFGEILFIAFAAVLCGVRTYELMERFAELREDWLRKWLKLPNGIPSYNTFSRVFQAIEPGAFAARIAEHLGRLGFEMQGGQIAIAGKIVGKGGHYILSVKGNQGRLHEGTSGEGGTRLRQAPGPRCSITPRTSHGPGMQAARVTARSGMEKWGGAEIWRKLSRRLGDNLSRFAH